MTNALPVGARSAVHLDLHCSSVTSLCSEEEPEPAPHCWSVPTCTHVEGGSGVGAGVGGMISPQNIVPCFHDVYEAVQVSFGKLLQITHFVTSNIVRRVFFARHFTLRLGGSRAVLILYNLGGFFILGGWRIKII